LNRERRDISMERNTSILEEGPKVLNPSASKEMAICQKIKLEDRGGEPDFQLSLFLGNG